MENYKKANQSIYIDSKTGNVLVAQKGDKNSYTFYATKISPDMNMNNIDVENLSPISDIFDYIDKNNIDIKVLSKEMPSLGEKRHGK